MRVTIHLPAVDGVSIEQVAEFWRELLDDAEVAIPYEIAFQEDGSYTMAIDQEHESNVRFFVDNGNILDWHASLPVITPLPNADEMNGTHDLGDGTGSFDVYWYDPSYVGLEAGEPLAEGWYFDKGNGEVGPFTTSTEAHSACLASGGPCAS